ncbi:hypothetical protein GALL_261080 [mine drainage metagenome]|jgi:hypothetical protein|uniref:Uncharacterized protein n=1 Tax=mine drainage metagenome TaxID=410659 RepID=A0A1J5RIP0_9ZZZZ
MTFPRTLVDINDTDLLALACEPGFLEPRTALELDLLWRLEMAVHAVEVAEAENRRLVDALLGAQGGGHGLGRTRSARPPRATCPP